MKRLLLLTTFTLFAHPISASECDCEDKFNLEYKLCQPNSFCVYPVMDGCTMSCPLNGMLLLHYDTDDMELVHPGTRQCDNTTRGANAVCQLPATLPFQSSISACSVEELTCSDCDFSKLKLIEDAAHGMAYAVCERGKLIYQPTGKEANDYHFVKMENGYFSHMDSGGTVILFPHLTCNTSQGFFTANKNDSITKMSCRFYPVYAYEKLGCEDPQVGGFPYGNMLVEALAYGLSVFTCKDTTKSLAIDTEWRSESIVSGISCRNGWYYYGYEKVKAAKCV